MSMRLWMYLWYGILVFSILSFTAMLLVISLGAFRELKQTLDDLGRRSDDE